MRIHEGTRAYVCEVCEKAFTQKSHLTRHMYIHTGERKHGCEVCGKWFVESADLKKHLKTEVHALASSQLLPHNSHDVSDGAREDQSNDYQDASDGATEDASDGATEDQSMDCPVGAVTI